MSRTGRAAPVGWVRPPFVMVAVAGIAGAAGLTLAACGGTGSQGPSGSGASSSTITIQNFAFSPDTDTVSPGETLTVENKDSVVHTLTSNSGAFNTGPIMPHRSRTFTVPRRAGTYPYRCTIHQYMTGTLTVR